MEYKQFRELVTEMIRTQYEERGDVRLMHVRKNNGKELYGIAIYEQKNELNGNILSPTIYLEPFYDAYCRGVDLMELIEQIVASYERYKHTRMPDTSVFQEFERAKKQIVFRLISRKGNEAYLEEVLHWPFLDLELICSLQLPLDESFSAVVLRKEQLEGWGITELAFWQEIFAEIKEPEMDCMSILDLVEGYTGRPLDEQLRAELMADNQQLLPMYVLTNRQRNYGAAGIVFPGVLHKAGQVLKEDFYVLPSSVHEVILVPVQKASPVKELAAMVREINQNYVEQEDFLSDTIYQYRIEDGKLSIA